MMISLWMEAMGKSLLKEDERSAVIASEACRVGKGARATCPPSIRARCSHGGHASLCPPYGSLRTNRLDIVAVGIDQERRIISRAVIGARPGAAIVAASGFQAFGMKLLDRRVVFGAERDMRR